jgi:thiol-disulfide isomerase/thioredoxin
MLEKMYVYRMMFKFNTIGMQSSKSALIQIGFSLLIFTAYIFSAMVGLSWKFNVGLWLYFVSAGWFFYKYKTFLITSSILLLPVFVPVIYSLFYFTNTLYSLPATLVPFVAVLAGFWLHKSNRIRQTIIVSGMASLGLLFAFFGRDAWRNFVKYGKATQTMAQPFPPLNLYTVDSVKMVQSSTDRRILVIDLWATTCAYCFQAFPVWAAWRAEYADNGAVEFMAVNLPLKGQTFSDIRRVLNKYVSVSINPVVVDKKGADFFRDDLMVDAIPTTVIVVNNEVRFRGDMSEGKLFLATIAKAMK